MFIYFYFQLIINPALFILGGLCLVGFYPTPASGADPGDWSGDGGYIPLPPNHLMSSPRYSRLLEKCSQNQCNF